MDANDRAFFAATAIPMLHSCNCIGPQNGQPKCPCMMRGVVERDGRWVQLEVDLGPVRQPVKFPHG